MKKKANKKKSIIRRPTVTAPKVQALRALGEQLGKLIPLSGYRSTFSLNTVAKDKGLLKYLPKKQGNKKEVFFIFLKELYINKPRTIKILVREILPIAIEKRHEKGDPVLVHEAQDLINKLNALDIDLKDEIIALNLPKDRPKVVPPPIAIQKILDAFVLHPKLLPDCKKLFNDGHINESVRKALERFEKTIQDLTSTPQKSGQDLMSLTFSDTNPKIKVSNMSNPQEINKQNGFKFMCMGIMSWWRNNFSHGDEKQIPHHDALGRLILVSNLFHEIDVRIL